jgi:hypothetical protein
MQLIQQVLQKHVQVLDHLVDVVQHSHHLHHVKLPILRHHVARQEFFFFAEDEKGFVDLVLDYRREFGDFPHEDHNGGDDFGAGIFADSDDVKQSPCFFAVLRCWDCLHSTLVEIWISWFHLKEEPSMYCPKVVFPLSGILRSFAHWSFAICLNDSNVLP